MKSLQVAFSLSFLFTCHSRPLSRHYPLGAQQLLRSKDSMIPKWRGLRAESLGGRGSEESPMLQIKSQGAAALPPFPLMTSILQVFPCKADVSGLLMASGKARRVGRGLGEIIKYSGVGKSGQAGKWF